MKIGTQTVRLKRGSGHLRESTVCDTVVVPPWCEAFVRGSLPQATFREKTDGLLEGLESFRSETGLQLPSSLVEVTQNHVFVPVAKLSGREVTVEADCYCYHRNVCFLEFPVARV